MNHNAMFPIQVVFRNLSHSPAIETSVKEHAEKLGTFFDNIMSCHVTIETHHHHNKGNIYHVGIDLKVPTVTLIVSRDPKENHAHEDVYVAIRDAFDAMRRQLQEHAKKLRNHD